MEVENVMTVSVASAQNAGGVRYNNGGGNGSSSQTVISPGTGEVEVRVVQAPERSDSGGGNAAKQGGRDEKPLLEMPGSDTLKRAVDDVNKAIEVANRRVDVRVHERTGHIMVKIVDDETGETVREIPPEKTLDYLAKVLEKAGVLVDAKG